MKQAPATISQLMQKPVLRNLPNEPVADFEHFDNEIKNNEDSQLHLASFHFLTSLLFILHLYLCTSYGKFFLQQVQYMYLLAARGQNFEDALNVILPKIMTKAIQLEYGGTGKPYHRVANLSLFVASYIG